MRGQELVKTLPMPPRDSLEYGNIPESGLAPGADSRISGASRPPHVGAAIATFQPGRKRCHRIWKRVRGNQTYVTFGTCPPRSKRAVAVPGSLDSNTPSPCQDSFRPEGGRWGCEQIADAAVAAMQRGFSAGTGI